MTTAIISALREEQAGLLQLLSNHQHDAQKPRELEHGLIHGKPVILALAGIGKVAAATTATLLIERHHVQRIIFTGVAGAVATHVHVGDVVVGNAYLQHDLDASPIFPRYEVPGYGQSQFEGDASLVKLLSQAAHAAVKDSSQLHTGLIISGDRFVNSAQEVQALRRELPDALCVEMEGAAIAQVCFDYRLPFAAVRTISDRADGDAHVDFPKFVSEVAGPMATKMIDVLMKAL